jgi:ABC-type lipoprotein release transport system permease subunit
MRHGASLTAFGLLIGVAGAAALTRVLRGILYGVAPIDYVTFGSVAVVLGIVSLAACLTPARRAARVDPSVALRYE